MDRFEILFGHRTDRIHHGIPVECPFFHPFADEMEGEAFHSPGVRDEGPQI